MLSIIVSSYKESLFNNLKQNIADTIGEVDYEIIKIYNPNKMSIAKAYNEGTAKSKFDYLLYLHEDVEFMSRDWGRFLIEKLSRKEIGLLGLAGSSAKSKITSGWNTGYSKSNYFSLLQGNNGKMSQMKNFEGDIEVVAIDGFFMGARKNILSETPFDEKLISGFHGYDLYLSLSVGSKYKLILTDKIEAYHFSIGTPNEQWFETNMLINEHFKNELPKYSKVFSKNQQKEIEFQALKALIKFQETNEVKNIDHIRNSVFSKETKKLIGLKNYILIRIYIYLKFKITG